MGWVTLSLRKMVMTQKVSRLEHRLVQLSQEQQSMHNSSSYAERVIGIDKTEAFKALQEKFTQDLNNITNPITQGGNQANALAQYQVQLQQSQLDYMYNKMMIESVFTAKEQALQDKINDKQTYLDLEQEQVETQLEAARAELEQLDDAVSKDIERSTISLV